MAKNFAFNPDQKKTFVWDELLGEIHPGPARNKRGWRKTKTYDDPHVREYRSDRGHLALETEAHDIHRANMHFAKHSEEYAEQMRGMDYKPEGYND